MLTRRLLTTLVACLAATNAVAADTTPRAAATPPPSAEARPYSVESPNGARVDPYYWLRDDTRSKPEMLDYLKAENAYYEAMTAPYKSLTERLAAEIIGRVKQDDSTAPYKYKDYRYYTRYETGKEYPIVARQPLSSKREEILVDAN